MKYPKLLFGAILMLTAISAFGSIGSGTTDSSPPPAVEAVTPDIPSPTMLAIGATPSLPVIGERSIVADSTAPIPTRRITDHPRFTLASNDYLIALELPGGKYRHGPDH